MTIQHPRFSVVSPLERLRIASDGALTRCVDAGWALHRARLVLDLAKTAPAADFEEVVLALRLAEAVETRLLSEYRTARAAVVAAEATDVAEKAS